MKKLLSEFREFLTKGNALDLAVGVIIGGAFGSVINRLVDDLIMPPIGMLLGKVNFSDLYIQLNKKAVNIASGTPLAVAKENGAVVIAYGNFLTAVLYFLIVALCIFMIIRAFAKIREKAEAKNNAEKQAEPSTEKVCPFCKSTIPIGATRCPHCTSQLEE